jgi:beta-lactamase class A
MKRSKLEDTLGRIAEKPGMQRASVAFYDYKSMEEFGHREGESFHAASTIKLAVLLALFKAADEKKLRLEDSLHVRNRFISVADGMPYRLQRGRDADEQVHDRIGRTMHIQQLAHLMITVSSNLATNLLLDYIGVDYARKVIEEAGITGVKLERGVEDHSAHEKGINNEVTAAGLVRICRVIQEAKFITAGSREKMLEIMFDQKFNSMIPEKLPESAEVSTVCHDAGLVFLENREPYALAILTEVTPDSIERHAPVAAMSKAVFEHLSEA